MLQRRGGVTRVGAAAVAVAIAVLVGSASYAQPAPGRSGGAPGASSKPHPKVDNRLQDLVAADARGEPAAAGADQVLKTAPDGRALIDVYLRPEATDPVVFERETEGLRQAGLEVVASRNRDATPVVEGWIPLGQVAAVEAIDSVRSVNAVARAGVDSGTVLSQGDASHNGPAARALGVSGAGLNVGVISDSMDHLGTGLAASQASGNLPANVTVLSDNDPFGTDEGRAMAEIIYDTAPGLNRIYFASGTASGAVGKANAIDALVASGVNIIADDIYYLDQPYFQDGVVAQAVDAAKAAGVAYFASAGNRARQSWEGTFAASGANNDFGGGDTSQTVVTVPSGSTVELVLQWDEPWGAATTDLDVQLRRTDNATLLASSSTANIGALPLEDAFWYNNTASAVSVDLRIIRQAGVRNPFMKYIARGNFGTFTVAEHATNSNTINPDAAAASGSTAVAAVNYAQAGLNSPEVFSSRGKLTRRFDKNGVALGSPEVRQKPQIAGADGVATSVGGFSTFYGTSAATPSVAGVAALVWSAQPALTVPQLVSILESPSNTINCTAPNNPDGSDDDCGFGFVLADLAVAQAQTTGGAGYHPLTPSRILDSRGPTGNWNTKLTTATKDLQVTGLGGASNVPASASAVVMNVTATGGSNGSFVSAWPSGATKPNSSNLNFGPGQTIPNLVTVKLGTGGKVSFANAVGTVDVIADVVGYYDDGTGPGDLFTGITPTRLLDSRGPVGGWNGTLAAGTPRDLSVRQPGNALGVPATATAVVANVTATGGSDGSFVSVWPSDVSKPNVSNLNFAPGQTIPNLAIIKIGAGGTIRFANEIGTVHLVVDIVGYFDPTGGSRFHAVTPNRVLDDRVGNGLSGPWGQGQSRALPLAGAFATKVPAGATGVVANVTATQGSTGSFVTVYPDGVAKPNASNLNFGPGETIPNLVTVKVALNGKIDLYNELGTVDLIADVVGYYAAT